MAISQITSKSITDSTITSDDIATGAVESSMTTQIGGRRNLIINGAMQVAQRGTQITGFTASPSVYFVDRMKASGRDGEIGTWTISQDTDAPSGFGNSAKYLCTTADTSLTANAYMSLAYEIEGYDAQPLNDTTGTKAFTCSFWVKSNKTGTYVLELNNNDDASKINKAYTVDSADTWEYKTINIPANSGYFFDSDNTSALTVFFWLLAGTDYTTGSLNDSWSVSPSSSTRAVGVGNLADTVGNYWQITGLQLEVGSVATPFEHISYGESLAACQRYYIDFGGQDFLCTFIDGNTSTRVGTMVQFPVSMRAAPSMSYSTPNVGSTLTQGTSTESYWSVFNSDSANRGAITYIEDVIADSEL